MKKTISTVVALTILLAMALTGLTACNSAAPATSPTTAATVAPSDAAATEAATAAPVATSKYKEAPALAAKVKDGSLPAVEARLPEHPLVVTPQQTVGKYGGTWRQSVPIGNKIHALAGLGFYSGRGLVVWSEDKKTIVPNIAESVTPSADSKVYTIKLRKGLKWSDGQPMTTKDVEFWWKSYMNNKVLTPVFPSDWESVEVNIVDETTFEIKYPTPQPLKLNELAAYQWTAYFLPEHYLKAFHPDFTAAADVDKAAKDAGFDDWGKYFADRMDYQNNPELPTMSPWMLVTKGSAATSLTYERNPYYFAVDTDGNQLPYIDTCVINIVESADITKMKAISGEFEVAVAAVMENFADYPLYAENATAGDYKVNTAEFDEPNAMNIHFNITNKDAEKRAIVEKVEFRQAMSLALNRPEIIATNYTVGPKASEIRQFSPYPGSPYFDKDLSTQYTQFDKDTANKMLDALGLDKKNADGMRLMPSGKVFSIVIDVPSYSDQWIDIGTMMAKNWKDVGIDASARSVDPSLWGERMKAYDFDCTIMTGGGGFAALDKQAVNDYTGYLSVDWPKFFNYGNYIWRDTQGKEGIEPSAAIKRLWELGAALVIEPDKTKQDAMVKEILQIHKDNLFVLGIGTRLPAIYLVKNYVKNVPALDPSWSFGCTGHGRPEQYFIDK